MNIIKCLDCGKDVSKNAESCPSCGAPIKPKSKGGCLKFGCLGLVILFAIGSIVPAIVGASNDIQGKESVPSGGYTKTPIVPKDFWDKRSFVDEFGKSTTSMYVRNDEKIIGKFSNTATQKSPLGVVFLITSEDVAIQLYEYNRSVPVKWPSEKAYELSLESNGKKASSIQGILNGDRITFKGSAKDAIIGAIAGNMEINFYIVEKDNSTTEYNFSIPAGTNFGKIKL
jgi:hypothetical protein